MLKLILGLFLFFVILMGSLFFMFSISYGDVFFSLWMIPVLILLLVLGMIKGFITTLINVVRAVKELDEKENH